MYESTLPACTLLRAHSSRRTSSDPRPSHVLCGPMKAAPHGAVHDAGQPHVDRTGCHARRPLGGITGAGRRGGSSAAGFRWPSLAFRSQIYYFRSSRESEASTCTHDNCEVPARVYFPKQPPVDTCRSSRICTHTHLHTPYGLKANLLSPSLSATNLRAVRKQSAPRTNALVSQTRGKRLQSALQVLQVLNV